MHVSHILYQITINQILNQVIKTSNRQILSNQSHMSHKVRDIVTLNAGSGSVIPGLSEISKTHCIHRKIQLP